MTQLHVDQPEPADGRRSVEGLVLEVLASFGSQSEEVGVDSTLESIDVDSLDLIELGQVVEEEYDVRLEPEDLANVVTVREAIDAISARVGTP
jgi:acyl carrier protein